MTKKHMNKLSKKKRRLLIVDLGDDILDKILEKEGISNIKGFIETPGYISHEDLSCIYNGAFVFLYTSLRESFGIPLLEAMASGVPVITSNTSAMPEIAGKNAILVDPTNADMIVNKMLLLESDSDFYNSQIQYGLERVKQFSWTKTAEELLCVYKEIE